MNLGYGYGMYYFDYSYIFVIIGILLTAAASMYLNSIYAKYSRISARASYTPADIARIILKENGIEDVAIGEVPGSLTDHYIPSKNVLNLSDTTRMSHSIAAYGVAAHEVGHALQDAQNFAPLSLSIKIAPTVSLASQIAIPIIFIGLILGYARLFNIGIMAFSLTLLYQLVTLPVEFDASNRAIAELSRLKLLDEDELYGVKKVLFAAAMTYVAAAASTLLQILRFVSLSRRRD